MMGSPARVISDGMPSGTRVEVAGVNLCDLLNVHSIDISIRPDRLVSVAMTFDADIVDASANIRAQMADKRITKIVFDDGKEIRL